MPIFPGRSGSNTPPPFDPYNPPAQTANPWDEGNYQNARIQAEWQAKASAFHKQRNARIDQLIAFDDQRIASTRKPAPTAGGITNTDINVLKKRRRSAAPASAAKLLGSAGQTSAATEAGRSKLLG